MSCKGKCKKGCEPKKEYKIRYDVPAGTYESDSLIGLCWEVLKHRTWHLFRHGRWTD